VKSLKALIIDLDHCQGAGEEGDHRLEALTHPPSSVSTERTPRWLDLHTLYVINGSFSIEAIRTVVEAYRSSLKRLRFASCNWYDQLCEEEILYWLEPIVGDVKFETNLDYGIISDWDLYLL
jgi:hypothetical protein